MGAGPLARSVCPVASNPVGDLVHAVTLSGHWIDLVHNRRPPRGIVLDMDSSVSPTHGEQEMSIWNGHYQSTCYHPLFVFNQFGDPDAALYVPATCTAPTAGRACSSRSSCGIAAGSGASIFRADAAFAAMTVAEALASATPVIATKGRTMAVLAAEGCGWWIDHGVDPWLPR